jgi:TPP-dependent 2-oxoacid decarboxylase
LPEVFGGGWGRRVATEDELDDALAQARASNEGPVLIEIMLDRFDTSEALKRLCAELSPDRGQRTAQGGQTKPRAKVFQGARNRV